MKKTLLQWLIILLIAGGVWYVVSLKEEGTELTNGTEVTEVVEEDEQEEPESGTYVIYETSVGGSYSPEVNTLYRIRPFEDEAGTAFATITADDGIWSGSVWSETTGTWVHVHRYFADADALVEIDGTVARELEKGMVASSDGSIRVFYELTFENRAASVDMQVYSGAPTADAPLVDRLLDPAELGITLGYAAPFLVSDDGNSVYLRQIFEGEGCNINGLWRLDVTTGELEALDVLEDLDIVDFSINPTTEQLIGVGYQLVDDPEAIGPSCGKADGTRTIYLVDLKTGEQQVLVQDDELVYYRPMLSDDGTQYATQIDGSESIWIGSVGSTQGLSETVVGYLEDWVGDTLVFNWGGELKFVNLKTSKGMTLGKENGPYDTAEYVGTITVE